MNARVLPALFLAATLAACSGGTAAAPSASAAHSPGSLSIAIPVKTASGTSYRRGPAFVSPSAQTAVIALNDSPYTVVDISPASNLCATAAGVRTCSIPLTAPVGSAVFAMALLDGPVTGSNVNVVGAGIATVTVVAGQPFNCAMQLVPTPENNGYTINYTNGLGHFVFGVSSTATTNFNDVDIDGNAVPPGSIPNFSPASGLTVTLDPPAHITAAPLQPLNIAQSITYTYDGLGAPGAYPIDATLTIPGYTGNATFPIATLQVQ